MAWVSKTKLRMDLERANKEVESLVGELEDIHREKCDEEQAKKVENELRRGSFVGYPHLHFQLKVEDPITRLGRINKEITEKNEILTQVLQSVLERNKMKQYLDKRGSVKLERLRSDLAAAETEKLKNEALLRLAQHTMTD